MLDPDISTAEALAHLSRPETDANVVDRRRFLQLVGMGVGAGVLAGPGSSLLDIALPGLDPAAWAAGPLGPNDGVLIVLGMFGGNDGLNTVVPIDDGHYRTQHGALAVPAGRTLPIDGQTGLHPELSELKRFWDAGQLAIVEGVGYPKPDLSHFNSMAYWMAGKTAGIPTSGWLGRWLDGYLGSTSQLFAAAEIGHSVPLHLLGERHRGTAVPAGRPSFGAGTSERDRKIYAAIRRLGAGDRSTWQGRVGGTMVDQLDMASTLAPLIPQDDQLPDAELTARLEVMARLVNANLGFRVLTAGWGDFDSHAGQANQHPERMRELNAALARFFAVLSPSWRSRVTVMTFSEFGRTSWSDGDGTDHGTAAPHFVLGANVRGGRYGQRPSLAGLRRWDRMTHHVDYRDYYGSVLDGWLDGGASDVFGGRRIDDLGLFSGRPGVTPAPTGGAGGAGTAGAAGTAGVGGGAGTALGSFVPLSPARVFDSRRGLGGAQRPLSGGSTVDVTVVGRGGLPTTGIRSVVVNVTSVNATQPTNFRVFPCGLRVPDASSLNPRPGRAVPNLVVVDVGRDGKISVFNGAGSADCVIDVMGYFRSTPASRLRPLVPARLLDSRYGVGVARGRRRGGTQFDLQVAGRGGVPAAGATAVVMNVGSVRPTSRGYVTVWPQGERRPEISNLNYTEGMNVPNLVVCKLGGRGKVSLFTSSGELDLIADVVGCFTGEGVEHVGLPPTRLLNTRDGTGARRGVVRGGSEIELTVAGAGGVAKGAAAVILNVTGVGATSDTFVTVYPDGVERPEASTLNLARGGTAANLVIAKVGSGGKIRLYNNSGAVDLVADVMGYFV